MTAINEEELAEMRQEYVALYGDAFGVVVLDGQHFAYDAVVHLMDDDIRENVHADIAPCTDQEFLDAYCLAHEAEFNEEFIVN
jgi:hypothetical protein